VAAVYQRMPGVLTPHRAPISSRSGQEGATALHMAVLSGHARTVRALHKAGADAHVRLTVARRRRGGGGERAVQLLGGAASRRDDAATQQLTLSALAQSTRQFDVMAAVRDRRGLTEAPCPLFASHGASVGRPPIIDSQA
jgi:hypothetical protein